MDCKNKDFQSVVKQDIQISRTAVKMLLLRNDF